MALLHDIQAALLDEKVGVGAILLKLRFLASKLGVNNLEDWVKNEAEGYPRDAAAPDYRKTTLSYTGTFSNGYQTLSKVSVAPYLIRKEAGDHWVDFTIRDSIAVIDTMLAREDRNFGIDVSDLKLIIQDKIYEGVPCIELHGRIDASAFTRIQNAVRTKMLDLTLELEKSVPAAAHIIVGQPVEAMGASEKAQVAQIVQNIFHGDVTNINNSGDGAQISLKIAKGDSAGLIKALTERGIPKLEAAELATIIEGEKPTDSTTPLGKKAKTWLSKAASGAWGIGKDVLTDVAVAAAKQYWGL